MLAKLPHDGCPILPRAQRLAGHSDIATTERHYLSVRAEDLQAARDLAPQLLDQIMSWIDP